MSTLLNNAQTFATVENKLEKVQNKANKKVVKNFFRRAKLLVGAYERTCEDGNLGNWHMLGRIINEGKELGEIYEANKEKIGKYANKPTACKYTIIAIIVGLINYGINSLVMQSTVFAKNIGTAPGTVQRTAFEIATFGTMGIILLGIAAEAIAKIIRNRRQAVLEETLKIIKTAQEFGANLNKN